MTWDHGKSDRLYQTSQVVFLPPRFCTQFNDAGVILFSNWVDGYAEVGIMETPPQRELISFEELDAASARHWRLTDN